MSNKLIVTLDEFVDKNFGHLSLGFKPSGRLHPGSILTLIQAFLYAEKHPGVPIDVAVMDLDYDQQRGRNFPSYFMAKNDEGVLKKEQLQEDLEEASAEITDVMNLPDNPVTVNQFSDSMYIPEMQQMFRDMVQDPELTKAIKRALFDRGKRAYTLPLTGICPSCYHSNTSPAKVDRTRKTMTSTCKNEICDVEEYTFLAEDIGGYNIHYLIDPIRDIVMNQTNVAGVHIFGGDYASPSGQKKYPKATRVHNVMRLFTESENIPDIYVGPQLTFLGRKMSKSCFAFAFHTVPNRKDLMRRFVEFSRNRETELVSYESLQ